MQEPENLEEFSFKNYFVPLTTAKAITWIVIIGFIVFFNSLFNDFLLDDIPYIISNTDVHSFNLLKIFGPSLFNTYSFYRPIPALYFTILYSVFFVTPFFYHLLQIILHNINAILVFLLFNRFFNKKLAFFFSLIFLIHPIQVESVSFISQSVNQLFFFFGISALLLSQKNRISHRRFICIFTLLLLSFLTKETGFLFLFLIIISRLFLQKKYLGTFFIFGLLTAIVYFIIRFGVGHVYFAKTDTLIVPIAQASFMQRLYNIPAIGYYYIKTFFFPIFLASGQQWMIQSINFSNFYLPFIIDIFFFSLLFFLGINSYKKNKKSFYYFLFFFLWFVSGMLIHLQIFPLDMTVSDPWFYFPLVGLLGLIECALHQTGIEKIIKKNNLVFIILGILLITLLSMRTMIRNSNWQNELVLYRHDVQVEDDYNSEDNLGEELSKGNDYNQALYHLQKSITMSPNGQNLTNIGALYEKMNNRKKAEKYYTKAIEIYKLQFPNSNKVPAYLEDSYYGLSKIFLLNGDSNSALNLSHVGLNSNPNSVNLLIIKALAEYKLHNYSEALTAAEKAKKLMPSDNTAYFYRQILDHQPITLTVQDGHDVIIE